MWAHRLEETEEKEGQVVVATCNRSRAESRRLATGSGGSRPVRGRAKDKRPRQEIVLCRIGATRTAFDAVCPFHVVQGHKHCEVMALAHSVKIVSTFCWSSWRLELK